VHGRPSGPVPGRRRRGRDPSGVAEVKRTAGPAGTATEREAKLIAPPGFALPDLTDLVPGTVTVALPEEHLDATYYDTADLRLARAGITLRHRAGERGPQWTVKLPDDSRGPELARREIRFDGPHGRVPENAADLVLASTRGRDLEPVARLATLRRPIEIRDGDGGVLAEVVDDTVSVSQGERPKAGFREVEVELHAFGRSGRRLLDAALSCLVGAGCIAEPPVPKLVRALGEPATRPPDVIASMPAADATVVDLVQSALARSMVQILRHDPGVRLGEDAEHVHQLRVATRRMRSDLRSFAPLLDRGRLAPIRDELGWLGGVVGAVRDRDVLSARLTAHIAALPGIDAPGADWLLCQLQDEAGDARTTMLAALRGDRYMHLLDTLVILAAAPPFIEAPELTAPWPSKAAAKIARRQWRPLADAVAALRPDPTDGALHRVRILAKRCRYTAEAVAPIVGPTAARFAAAVADVQTVLGDHQDTVVAEAWLRDTAATAPAGCPAADQLIAVERSLRIELRAQWTKAWRTASAQKLRRWL